MGTPSTTEFINQSLQHHPKLADDELSHYGVKGMKWGVRRSRAALARARGGKKSGGSNDGPEDVKVSTTPGERVKAKGGARQPASEDAVRTAAKKQKARASTTDSLSTKELKEIVERMNLERQYSKLNPPKKSLGKEFAQMVFENDKQKLAQTGDWKQTSTYKLGKTAIDVGGIVVKAAKKSK